MATKLFAREKPYLSWVYQQLVFWLPVILSLGLGIFIGTNQIELRDILTLTGSSKPQSWVVLPPALKLIGALVLLTIPGTGTEADKKWAKRKAKSHAGGKAPGETIDQYLARWSSMQLTMLSSLRPKLKRFEDGLGFGFLSLGLTIGILAISSIEAAPLHWAANTLLAIGLLILLIKVPIWNCYRNKCREEVFEEMKILSP